MKKRLAALVLAALLIFTLVPDAFAAPELILVCTDGAFQQPTEDAMPVFIDGVLYMPYSFLNDVKALNCVYNSSLQQLLVYNLDYRMTFDLAGDQTYDAAGEFFAGTAVWRGGTVFVPVKLICFKFKLYFSYIEKNSANIIAPVVRIASETPSVDDMPFIVRNIAAMKRLADAYNASIQPSGGEDEPSGGVRPPVRPTEPELETLVYFIFQGEVNEYTGEILDVLARRRISAAFFVDTLSAPDGDILRRIYGEGHAVGLYAELEGLSDEETKRELLRAGEALSAVLHTKARLLSVRGGSETLSPSQVELVIGMGFRLWDGNVYASSDSQSAASAASGISRRLSASTLTKVAAFYSEEHTAAVLERVAAYVADGNFSLLTVNEWDAPINAIREIR